MRANERPRLLGTEAAVRENEVEMCSCNSSTAPTPTGTFPAESPPNHKPATPEPAEPIPLADALARLNAILTRLTRVIEKPESRSQTQRLTLRIEELAEAIGVSRRVLERELSAGRFPKPDLRIGKMPLWRLETISAWLENGGRL